MSWAVPQAVAANWIGVELCPHCRGAVGTLRHRMWERAAVGASLGPPVGCPIGLAASGVLPEDADLAAAARALHERVPAPAAGVEAATAYTDGSVFDVSDPMLARAGWAAALVNAQGRTLRVQSAGVDGPQMGPWAELQVAAEGTAGAVLVVTDCEHEPPRCRVPSAKTVSRPSLIGLGQSSAVVGRIVLVWATCRTNLAKVSRLRQTVWRMRQFGLVSAIILPRLARFRHIRPTIAEVCLIRG